MDTFLQFFINFCCPDIKYFSAPSILNLAKSIFDNLYFSTMSSNVIVFTKMSPPSESILPPNQSVVFEEKFIFFLDLTVILNFTLKVFFRNFK